MIITEIPIEAEDLIPKTERSPGPHQSDIIKYLCFNIDPKRFGGEMNHDLFLAGFMWEEVFGVGLSRLLAKDDSDIITQLEIQQDGIWCTLDGFNTRTWSVIETKGTWMSAADPITSYKFRHWFWQIMGYCKAAGTRKADLFAFFFDGDYRPRRRIPRGWMIEFTRRQIEENWKMILNAKKDMEERGLAPWLDAA